MTDPAAAARVTRFARLLTVMVLLDMAAAVVVEALWRPELLGVLIGFCLAWATAVVLFLFQDARGARSSDWPLAAASDGRSDERN